MADADYQRGLRCSQSGNTPAALDAWHRCLQRQPAHPGALAALGEHLRQHNDYSGASALYQRAHQALPYDFLTAWGALYNGAFVCDWRQRELQETVVADCVAHYPNVIAAGETALSMPSMSPWHQRLAAQRWAQGGAAQQLAAAGPLAPHKQVYAGHSRLRIGYIGEDFHEQATAYLMAGVIELHDRRHFEVIGFDFGPQTGGPMQQRLARDFDQLISLHDCDPAGAARRIRDAEIDIAVYTSRPLTPAFQMLAMRPAPWQLAYLYYPATTGAEYIDYLVVDDVVAPAAHQAHFTEPLLHLPRCYQPHDHRRHEPRVLSREQLGLPPGALVLANFNPTFKYTPSMFRLWCQLLREHPHTVLMLLASNPEAMQTLRQRAWVHGVDPARLIFSPRMNGEDHLGRLRHGVDLVLDTFPYGGHTLGSDALWAGTPVLTLAGESFASRVGASLLHAVGLPQLVAHQEAEFLHIGRQLCQNPAQLQPLREQLIRARHSSSLFDTAGYVRDLEDAYLRITGRTRQPEPASQAQR